jgi:hypothetical protein
MTLVAEPVAREHGDARTFHFGPGVLARIGAFHGRCTVVRLASVSNERLGVPRWYTLAEAWAEPGTPVASRWSRNPVIDVEPSDTPELVLATGTPVVIIGADIALMPWQRAVVDAVRQSCAHVLVVEMAPSSIRLPPLIGGYADIETFGHDRDRGSRLLSLLCERTLD